MVCVNNLSATVRLSQLLRTESEVILNPLKYTTRTIICEQRDKMIVNEVLHSYQEIYININKYIYIPRFLRTSNSIYITYTYVQCT